MGEDIAQQRLFKKGAEASLFLTDWHERKVVIKTRLPKKYRPTKLDTMIRTYRTIHEPQLMNEAKKAGVPTPLVFQVDVKNATIIMEFIEGKQVKQLLMDISPEERAILCVKIGELIGALHRYGVIHGDLTTSNMILNPQNKIFLVDFGLGEKNSELEAKGVDLHLMKRALQSTHFQFAEDCFMAIAKGYATITSEVETKNVLAKVKEIERRGRYIDERRLTDLPD
ncbi:MAG TPA: KEOPS complex kinase/ATPase Bud32 [Candidatus Sulfotelmatobacter sp.]|nr:KEOPS complex kinase/ATPase Bud32 [Candidatus Sulfotelmatobacter sp.]